MERPSRLPTARLRRELAFGGGISALGALLAWWRIPSASRDVLWAEDGRRFLAGAAEGVSPLQPYAGYLHLVPRLEAALIVHAVPVAEWALAMTGINCLVAGVVAGLVAVLSRSAVPWWPARVLLALLTVATPLASREVLGNAANIHSLLLWLLLWCLLWAPRSTRASFALVPVVLLSTLSEVQSVFLLLLVVRRWSRRDAPHRIAFLIGVAAQLGVVAVVGRGSSGHPPVEWLSIPIGWVTNGVLTTFLPPSAITSATGGLGWGVLLLVAPLVAAAALVLVRGSAAQRRASASLLGLSIATWAGSVLITPALWLDYAAHLAETPWLSRYGVVPAMCLLAQVPIALCVLRRSPRWNRAALVGLVVTSVVLAAQAPTPVTRRTGEPDWAQQMPAAAADCGDGAGSVRLRESLGWRVTVPCSLIVGSRN